MSCSKPGPKYHRGADDWRRKPRPYRRKQCDLQDFGWGIHIIHLKGGMVAMIDSADAEAVSQFNWLAHKTDCGHYVRARLPDGTHKYLHRFIMEADDGTEVDHRNLDKLDNRRENLRLATRFQNSCNITKRRDNTSGFKGVTWDRARGKWVAQIGVHGTNVRIGRFDSADKAAEAYEAAAEKYHGEFARTRRPA